MTRANALRGEVALVLDGVTLCLRPSFAALVAAEDELGSLFALVERAAGGDLRLAEMAALAWHCAVEPGMERAEFEAALARLGLERLAGAYRALLAGTFGCG